MACSKCGKFTLFRDVCWTCNQLTSGSLVSPLFTGKKQIKWQWQAKILKVNINGTERTVDATGGLGEDVMQELAGHLAIPVTQLEDLLHLGHANQSAAVNVSRSQTLEGLAQTSNNHQTIARQRITMIECPKCSHRIAEGAWCLYCGHEL